jgi:hypothetical protein
MPGVNEELPIRAPCQLHIDTLTNNEIHTDFGKIGEPFVRDSLYTRSPSSSLKGRTSTERFAEAIARLAYPGHLDTKHMQAAVSGSAPAGAARRERDGLNRTEAACIDVSAGAVSISRPSSKTAVASRSMREGGMPLLTFIPNGLLPTTRFLIVATATLASVLGYLRRALSG